MSETSLGRGSLASGSALPPFKLERFFAKYEFNPVIKHLLCCSDSEPLTLSELLASADADSKRRYEELSLGYTESSGLQELREAIAARYTSITAEEVVVAAPQELIFLLMNAVLSPGDHVVCMFPGYQSLYQVAESMGCEVSRWEPRAEGAALRFDVSDFLSLLRPGTTKLVVVNTPHNPTGWLASGDEWSSILRASSEAGAVLLSDEMYRGLELDPSTRLPAAADSLPRAISLCGVSKSVGLPGLRIGWLASKDTSILKRVSELRDYTTICSSAPSEVLALAGVRAWDALAERQLGIISRNLRELELFFQRWSSVFDWSAPRAGTVAFPRLKIQQPVPEFCDQLALEDGVLLLPASVYDHAPSVLESRFRLGYGRRALPEGLAALERALVRRGFAPRE